MLKFSDLTEAEKEEVKLKYNDLTEADKYDLTQPSRDFVASVTEQQKQRQADQRCLMIKRALKNANDAKESATIAAGPHHAGNCAG